MKHIFKLSLILLFFCNSALKAESGVNYTPGYVIQLNGDTLKGQLLNQVSKSAGKKCVFRSERGEDKIFLPGEIQGYRYEGGKYYVTKEIQKDSLNKKTVFLEYLVKGIISMYYLYDNGEHYYAEKNGVGLMELTESAKITKVDNVDYVALTQTKGKLIYFMQDCPDVNNEIKNISLDHKSLIKLAKNYHEKVCDSESCIIYGKKNLSMKLQWTVFAGYSKNRYNFGGLAHTNLVNNFQIGAGFKLSNVFMFDEHLNLRVNLGLEKDAKYSTLSIYDDVSTVSIKSDDVSYLLNKKYLAFAFLPSIKAHIDVFDVNIPITLNKDILLTKKTTLFLGVGLANKFIISKSPKFMVYEDSNRAYRSINPWLVGVAANAGLEGKWFGNHTYIINANCEFFKHFSSDIARTYVVYNNQFSIQLGVFL